MFWIREYLVNAGFFDDLSRVHHTHAVGDLGNYAQIMCDQQNRKFRVRRKRSKSSRIWAWIVTSTAVVGSSAINNSGSHASAIAIMMPLPQSAGQLMGIVVSAGFR